MRAYDWSALTSSERREALERPASRTDARVSDTVARIFERVAAEGGAAVDALALELDGAPAQRVVLDAETLAQAKSRLSEADVDAIETAAANIRAFHEAARPAGVDLETTPGVRCARVWRPLNQVGIYVPGGSAPLFSSLLMQVIPAMAAGVENICVMTPPDRTGQLHPAMIVAGAAAGLDALWRLGGAQAIAAMTFGVTLPDGEAPRCDKIFGPGNAFVAEAKKRASSMANGPAIDMPAGPSELMVIADGSADRSIVAADLLSQAEHDADAQVLLVTTSQALVDGVLEEIERQVATLPRERLARASLAQGRVIRVDSLDDAFEVANAYAPEHLSLQLEAASDAVPRIRRAGAVFVGRFAAETLGDYVAGPSHVLPTDGAARAVSGLTTSSFMTSMSVQYVSEAGAARLGPIAARLARLEGLEAHARAADLRLPA